MREQPVGPLEPEDARRLALALLGSGGRRRRGRRRSVARESGGSPFLVEELARGAGGRRQSPASSDSATASGGRRADARQIIRERLGGSRPTRGSWSRSSPSAAARCRCRSCAMRRTRGRPSIDLIGLLRAERFVRSGFRDGHEVDRADARPHPRDDPREPSFAALRERHAQLARALEAMPGADLEALAAHLLGAGDKERAARLRRARGRAGGVEARLRPGRAPLPGHAADHRPRSLRDAPPEHAPGRRCSSGQGAAARRRSCYLDAAQGRARAGERSSSNAPRPSSCSRAAASTRERWCCAASSRRWASMRPGPRSARSSGSACTASGSGSSGCAFETVHRTR